MLHFSILHGFEGRTLECCKYRGNIPRSLRQHTITFGEPIGTRQILFHKLMRKSGNTTVHAPSELGNGGDTHLDCTENPAKGRPLGFYKGQNRTNVCCPRIDAALCTKNNESIPIPEVRDPSLLFPSLQYDVDYRRV